ncbi:MAG: fasciclin domain-containing protein [Bacteroidales bacterium]|nr:fasciclin domain-containing protein [Bacteroidales bacterium]
MKHMMNKWSLLLLGLTCSLLTGCDPWSDVVEESENRTEQDVMQVLRSQKELSLFVELLEKAGYDKLLTSGQAFTVFAPSNESLVSGDQLLVDTADVIKLSDFLQNVICKQSITQTSSVFTEPFAQMINKKNIALEGNRFDGYAVVKANLLAGNGVVHIVSGLPIPRLNIWEYINQATYEAYPQVQFLHKQLVRVMDEENSYLLYRDEKGRPVYDTAWIESNPWLEQYPINNEDSTFAFVLLQQELFDQLVEKYAPYFTIRNTIVTVNSEGTFKEIVEQPDSTLHYVTAEITRDMILMPVQLQNNAVAMSVDGIRITIPADALDVTYKASNGWVYQLFDVDVKMYQNKIKEIFIEGEDFVSSNVASTIISTRFKDWASSNFDVVLSGRDSDGRFALSSQSTSFYSNVINSYLAYKPVLNSIEYEVYWMSYDDLASHIEDTVVVPQKLFFSNPGAPALRWSSGGSVSNNFSDTLIYVGQSTAGIMQETRLGMWSTTGTALRVAKDSLLAHPDYDVNRLSSISYGTSNLWVANNVFATNDRGGSLFLDYLRLVPVIDPEK